MTTEASLAKRGNQHLKVMAKQKKTAEHPKKLNPETYLIQNLIVKHISNQIELLRHSLGHVSVTSAEFHGVWIQVSPVESERGRNSASWSY